MCPLFFTLTMKIFFKGVTPIVSYFYVPNVHRIAVLDDGEYRDIRYVIYDTGTHPTAYIGMNTGHRLAGLHYDQIYLPVHGGLTYSEYGNDRILSTKYYWIGWDYAHYGDYTAYDLGNSTDKRWTYFEILIHVIQAINDFKNL